MWRLIKFLIFLAILAAFGFIVFALVGPFFMQEEFSAPVREVVKPVTLGGN